MPLHSTCFFYLEIPLHKCDPDHPDQKGNKSGCCGKYGPCPAYIGDCNSNSQCEGDLLCNIHDQGNTYGYSVNAVDVCVPKSNHISLVKPLNITCLAHFDLALVVSVSKEGTLQNILNFYSRCQNRNPLFKCYPYQ